MSKLTSRIERLERRQPAKKVPSNDEDIVAWALNSLFPSTPQAEPTPVDGASNPYLVFLQLIRSDEFASECARRGFPLESDAPPAWQKEWLEKGAAPGKWDDPEGHRNQRPSRGNIEPY
jgi:hypothetical protein